MEQPADSSLVAATREGNGEAFTSLYRRYAQLVRTILRDFTDDPEELADLVQEVFARAYASLPSLREPDRFRPWLQAIARHVGRDSRRARHRERPAEMPEDALQASDEPDPGDVAAYVELAELVGDVIVELRPRDAVAMTLVRLGFGPREMASSLGISYGAAKVTLHRARTRLRTAVLLRLLLRDGRLGCEMFAALREGSERGALTRHVARCSTCARALAVMLG